MKKSKEFKKRKLSLSKDVIANLNDAQMSKIKGGACTQCGTGCVVNTCATCHATNPPICVLSGTCATNCGTCCNTSC